MFFAWLLCVQYFFWFSFISLLKTIARNYNTTAIKCCILSHFKFSNYLILFSFSLWCYTLFRFVLLLLFTGFIGFIEIELNFSITVIVNMPLWRIYNVKIKRMGNAYYKLYELRINWIFVRRCYGKRIEHYRLSMNKKH